MHHGQEKQGPKRRPNIKNSHGELIELKSMGLDIGSSTSHLILSRLVLAKIVLVSDNDVGKIVGHLLADLGIINIVSIDSIDIRQLSYVDIGQELTETRAVPVTVI